MVPTYYHYNLIVNVVQSLSDDEMASDKDVAGEKSREGRSRKKQYYGRW